MPIKFLDCPYCGRGLLELAFRAHVDEHFLPTGIADFREKGKKKPERAPSSTDKKYLTRGADGNARAGRIRPASIPAPKKPKAPPSNKEAARNTARPEPAKSKGLQKRGHPNGEVKGVNASAMVRMVQIERREEVEWQLAQLAKSELQKKTAHPSSPSDANLHKTADAGQRLRTKARKNKSKFVDVSTTCSCRGEFENCFKCGGSGIEVKRLATEPGCDTTLFSRSNGASRLAGLANDVRGDPFLLREKGTFDSRPVHDAYDDESLP